MTGDVLPKVPNVAPTLSVIVPTYRNGPYIYSNLLALDRVLSSIGEPYEIVVVSDGNDDNTHDEMRRLDAPHIHVYHYARNMGKGFALRYGVTHSCGQVVTFIDGDGDIDPKQIPVYLRIMRESRADVVIGSKRHPDSNVIYPPLRWLYSGVYQTLLRVFFRLQVRDTQVGLKLFRREVLAAVLPRIIVKRYAFDLELLVVASHLGFSRIVEAPVRIGQRLSSTINRQAIASILIETAAIFYRKNVIRYYDRPHGFVTLDGLAIVADRELSEMVDERKIVHNVVRWLVAPVERVLRNLAAPRTLAYRDRAADVADANQGVDDVEQEWRASGSR